MRLYCAIYAGAVGSEGTTSLSLEQEKYFCAIVSATPMGRLIHARDHSALCQSTCLCFCRETTQTSFGDKNKLEIIRITFWYRPSGYTACYPS
jgi:hypothetical protein